MKKFIAALMIAGAVTAAGAAGVQASSYNNGGTRTPTVSATTVTPGGSFSVSVGCVVGEQVTFVFQGSTQTIACVLSDAGQPLDGIATATFTAPATAGTFTGTVTVPGATQQSFSVTVQAVTATTSPSTGGLPPTGSDGTGSTMMIAALLLVAGAGMFGVAHMRRRSVTAV